MSEIQYETSRTHLTDRIRTSTNMIEVYATSLDDENDKTHQDYIVPKRISSIAPEKLQQKQSQVVMKRRGGVAIGLHVFLETGHRLSNKISK